MKQESKSELTGRPVAIDEEGQRHILVEMTRFTRVQLANRSWSPWIAGSRVLTLNGMYVNMLDDLHLQVAQTGQLLTLEEPRPD